MKTNAAGYLNGGVFGPTAQDLSAVWTLNDGTSTAVGVVGTSSPGAIGLGSYIVTAPDQATVGANPPNTPAQGLQIATPGGPTFTGSPTAPPAGTEFAATQTAIRITGSSITADSDTNAGGVTETLRNLGTSEYELKIPNLGIDADVTAGTNGYGQPIYLSNILLLSPLSPGYNYPLLNYVNFNQWSIKSSSAITTETGFAMIGYQTPIGSMPTTGSATYSSLNNVSGEIFQPSFGNHTIQGNGSMTANFATGAVSGSFTDMVVTGYIVPPAPNPAWNTVNFTGSISNTAFTGTTSSAALVPNYDLVGFGASSGTISGGFYGPNANEAGAVWTLSDGANLAIGIFGAPQYGGPVTTINPFSSGSYGFSFFPMFASGNTTPNIGLTPGVSFQLTQQVVAISEIGGAAVIGEDFPTEYGGATLVTQSNPQLVELKIPSVGVDLTFNPSAQGAPFQASNGKWVDLELNDVDYIFYGQWAVSATQAGSPTNTAWFISGDQTLPQSMPTTGTASYSVTAQGSVYGPSASPGAYVTGQLNNGQGTLTANFSTGAVGGTISGMTVTPSGGPSSSWNGFSVTASISGGSFSGTTAVTSVPSGTSQYNLNSSAVGTVAGNFYGPSANQLGALWALSDGAHSASGYIVGSKVSASDRRLKRDIETVGRVANGLNLYRYRYLGDDTLFVGVMAQELLDDPRFADAVHRRESGLMMVDYGRIGVDMPNAEAMRRAGMAAVQIYEASHSLPA